jgi:hypothetical protein
MIFTRTLVPHLCALSVLIAAPIAGCGGSSGGTGGSSSSSSAATGTGGAGGMVSCGAGSHLGDAGACEATLEGWTETSSLLQARDHHVTFLASTPKGAFLYAAGGTDDASVFDSVERATVAADGTLSPFTKVATLPKAVLGPGLAQVDNVVVLAGGLDGVSSVPDTFVGTIADDGGVSFTAGPPLETDRYHVSVSAHGGFVYAIGGLQQAGTTQKIVDVVERASFDGTTLGAFTAEPPLPMALTHQAAVVYQDALYLVGGISTSTTLTSIMRAAFDKDGHLGAWTQVGTLPEGRGTSAAFVFLEHLYVLGGAKLAQGGEVATVLRAPVALDGTVGAFEDLAPLPLARAHVHQNPLYQGFIYSAGGIKGVKMQKNVFVGKLD